MLQYAYEMECTMKWKRTYTHQKRWIKKHLINKYGTICSICSKEMRLEDMSIDHHIPMSKGGTDTIDNMRLAHVWCNGFKANSLPEDVKLYFS
jgi:HNH endonuclease.